MSRTTEMFFYELARRYRLRVRCMEVFILRNCEIHYRDVMVLTLYDDTSTLHDDISTLRGPFKKYVENASLFQIICKKLKVNTLSYVKTYFH